MLKSTDIKLLRIPFSIFLSPLYFFSLSQVPFIHWGKAILIFVILHFLVYPASNGYNSYMDRDTGSIGGLETPPEASKQLYPLTIALDLAGMLLSFWVGLYFGIGMLFYIGASKAYSYRGIRLKKYPYVGYLTVILFQGAATFWMVYHGASVDQTFAVPWQGMAICSLLIGGFYPLTQIYQHQQDLEDGVETISYRLGYRGTFVFCAIVYAMAFLLIVLWFMKIGQWKLLLLVGLFFLPVVIYFISWFRKVIKDERAANFKNTMRMNWLAASCTNTAFIILLTGRFF